MFTKGAAKVKIRADASLAELYRARFDVPPDVRVDGGAVAINQKRRFRPV